MRGKRIVKAPEERRQEILDAAMKLFSEKGYEETSMADIAREVGVVQGLCYRYFDSKQKLFQEAMERYVEECCAAFLPVIHDRSRTIRERLGRMAAAVAASDRQERYSAFYHHPGNQLLHEELSLRICRYLLPHVTEELRAACAAGELSLPYPEVTASYLLHAQIGLVGEGELPLEARMGEVPRYAEKILER